MARFCGNCGAEVEEDARVCGNCGTPLEDIGASNAGAGASVAAVGKKLDLKKIIIIAVAAVAAIIVLVIVGNVVKNNTGYRTALNKLFKSIEREDATAFIDSFCILWYDELEENRDDVEEYVETMLDGILDTLDEEVGANPRITYEVKDEKKFTNRRLENLREEMENQNDDYDGDDVKAAYEVDLKVEIKGADETIHSNMNDVIIIKENGTWKLYQMNTYSLL